MLYLNLASLCLVPQAAWLKVDEDIAAQREAADDVSASSARKATRTFHFCYSLWIFAASLAQP